MGRLEIAVAIAFGVAMETCDDPQRMPTAASASAPSAPSAEPPPPPAPPAKHLDEERVNLCAEVRRIAKGTKVLHVEDPASLEKSLAALSPAARTA